MKIKTMYENHLEEEIIKEIDGEVTVDQIFTDINTLLNSSPSRRQKKMIKVLKNIATLKVACEDCENGSNSEHSFRNHEQSDHES